MKKVLFFAVALITLSGVAQAQYKPTKGTFATELNFNPLGLIVVNAVNNTTVIDGPNFSLPMGIKGRYFLSDNLAVRVGLDFNFESTTNHDFTDPGVSPEVETIEKNSLFTFGIIPGIEYHFGNWEKTSLYCGAEIGIAMASAKRSEDDGTDKTETKGASTLGNSGFGFAFNVFTGFDYYFTKNLFVGAELGLGLNTLSTGTVETTFNGVTVEDKDYSSSFNFGFYCEPAIRLGWKF